MSLDLGRDLSIIWLSLFCIGALIPPVVILFFAVKGMAWLRTNLLPWIAKAQQGSRTVIEQTQQIDARVTTPLINLNRQTASLRATIQQLWPNSRGPKGKNKRER